jgi:hypothetical protein
MGVAKSGSYIHNYESAYRVEERNERHGTVKHG